jgi:Recombination endonuclease VII
MKMTDNERYTAWRKKQLEERPEEYRKYNSERAKKLYHKNPEIGEKQQKRFKERYDNDPTFRQDIVRHASLGRYGITPKEYDAKLKEQGGHCALCEATMGDAKRSLHVDHDHRCCNFGPPKRRTCGNCNRGLLCGPCNRNLQRVEFVLSMSDTPPIPTEGTWLSKAIQYLTQYKV